MLHSEPSAVDGGGIDDAASEFLHSPFNIAPMRLGAWHMCAEPKSRVVEMLYHPK